jgi:hypothetical protein
MNNGTATVRSLDPGRHAAAPARLPRPLTLSEAHALWTRIRGKEVERCAPLAPIRSERAPPVGGERSAPQSISWVQRSRAYGHERRAAEAGLSGGPRE